MARDRSIIDATADPRRLDRAPRLPFWVISDTHIGHANIVRYCGRPADHEQLMARRWRETVADDDRVVHLGDISLKPERGQEFLKRMPGRLCALVLGNHDRSPERFYRDELGFEMVGAGFELDYRGWRVLFSHRPDSAGAFVRYPRRLNVHGHVHDRTRPDRRLINVSVEATDYTPVNVADLLDARIAELTGTPATVA